jgi:hypothetical protein
MHAKHKQRYQMTGRRLIDVRLCREELMETSIVDRVAEEVRALAPELQKRVLEFARALAISTPRGVHGRQLLRFAGELSPEDARLMRETIEQGCEKVDSDEW